MEPQDVLETRRPLTREEVAQIVDDLIRPKDVDETLYNSVKSNLLRKYMMTIIGVETDPGVKAALMKRERTEEERRARTQTKLTHKEREDNNFPSNRDQALPKYYEINEIPAVIAQWKARLQAELIALFEYPGDKLEQTQLEERMAALFRRLQPVPSAKLQQLVMRKLVEAKVTDLQIPDLERGLASAFTENPLLDADGLSKILSVLLNEDRELTPSQIDEILNSLDYSTGETETTVYDQTVAEHAIAKVRKDLRRQLKRVKIQPSAYPRLKELIVQRFQRALALPGKRVGNIMAASFGEAATQQTLNTFHSAGDRNARKQITGFAKMKSLIEAVENPKSTIITIFMKERFTGEQLRFKVSNLQMTILSDLVKGHRVIPSADAAPYWEIVHDSIRDLRYDVYYDKQHARLNLHRQNPLFNDPRGRILEITLDTKEMFFRRISLSQVADAIEESSSDLRVVTSSMEIGLIYVFYNYSYELAFKSAKGAPPDFLLRDPFTFALENSVYPKILIVQISGIYNVDYVGVQYYKIKDAIDFGLSEIELKTERRRIYLQFVLEKTIMWGLSRKVVTEFVLVKMRRYLPSSVSEESLHLVYDEDTGLLEFDTASLRLYNYVTDTDEPLTMKEIQEELLTDTKLKAYEILRVTAPPGDGPPTVAPKAVTMHETLPDVVIIRLDAIIMDKLGLQIDEIASTLVSVFSHHDVRATAAVSKPNAEIYLGGIVAENDEGLDVYVETELRGILIDVERIEQYSLKWYYVAEGQNFQEVLAHRDVDAKYTRTDNIVEAYRILGVESCRSILLEEIKANSDAKINPVHVELLADAITARTPGDKPLAQNHYGQTKRGDEFGSLMWETTTKVAMRVGLGQVDNLRSFPSQIMMGMLNKTSFLTEADKKQAFSTPAFQFDGLELVPTLVQPEEEHLKVAEPIKVVTSEPTPPEEKARFKTGFLKKGKKAAKTVPAKTSSPFAVVPPSQPEVRQPGSMFDL